MVTLLCLLWWALLCALCGAGSTHTRIRVAMDSYPSRNPAPDQPASHALIDFRIVKTPTDIPKAVDVLAHAEWKTFKSLFSTKRAEFLPYFDNSDEHMTIMNEKGSWKTWMQLIGLGEHIPASLTHLDADTLEYPVIVKKSMSHSKIAHGGYGISVVHNPEQLRKLTESILTEGHTYFVEESLTGMGLSEMSSFGAAFRGKVVSPAVLQTNIQARDADTRQVQRQLHHARGRCASPAVRKGLLVGRGRRSPHSLWQGCGVCGAGHVQPHRLHGAVLQRLEARSSSRTEDDGDQRPHVWHIAPSAGRWLTLVHVRAVGLRSSGGHSLGEVPRPKRVIAQLEVCVALPAHCGARANSPGLGGRLGGQRDVHYSTTV
jgi:hypothetical protein